MSACIDRHNSIEYLRGTNKRRLMIYCKNYNQKIISQIQYSLVQIPKYYKFNIYYLNDVAFLQLYFTKMKQFTSEKSHQEVPNANVQRQESKSTESLYKKKIYKISKRAYRVREQSQKDQIKKNSLINYIKNILAFIKSVQLISLFQFFQQDTLQSRYRYISLAILNNSVNLNSAVLKALQYNIPLIQIIMKKNDKQEQKIVVQNVLKNFAVSHCINQNFVLYGDWSYQKHRRILQQQKIQYPHQGFIVFRKGQYVFAEIKISTLNEIDHNKLSQILLQIRDVYYKLKPFELFFRPNLNQEQKASNQIPPQQIQIQLQKKQQQIVQNQEVLQNQFREPFSSPTKSQKIVNEYLNNNFESQSQRSSPARSSQGNSSSLNGSSQYDDLY